VSSSAPSAATSATPPRSGTANLAAAASVVGVTAGGRLAGGASEVDVASGSVVGVVDGGSDVGGCLLGVVGSGPAAGLADGARDWPADLEDADPCGASAGDDGATGTGTPGDAVATGGSVVVGPAGGEVDGGGVGATSDDGSRTSPTATDAADRSASGSER
jgi:hypothetical protein